LHIKDKIKALQINSKSDAFLHEKFENEFNKKAADLFEITIE